MRCTAAVVHQSSTNTFLVCMIQLMVPGGSRLVFHDLRHMFPGLDVYYTDPAHHIISAGWDLDGISVDDLSVRRANRWFPITSQKGLALLEPQSRFGDKPLRFEVVCPRNGTAVLKVKG